MMIRGWIATAGAFALAVGAGLLMSQLQATAAPSKTPEPAVEINAWFEGEVQGAIESDCGGLGREGSACVHLSNHDISIPLNPQTGLPSGLRVHHPLIITKPVDRASPKLYQALVTRERFPEVKLQFYRPVEGGGFQHFYTVVLEDAVLVDIQQHLASGPGEGSETLAVVYTKIRWTWEPGGISAEDDWQDI